MHLIKRLFDRSLYTSLLSMNYVVYMVSDQPIASDILSVNEKVFLCQK
jgi:hypothetical protein